MKTSATKIRALAHSREHLANMRVFIFEASRVLSDSRPDLLACVRKLPSPWTAIRRTEVLGLECHEEKYQPVHGLSCKSEVKKTYPNVNPGGIGENCEKKEFAVR
jgi:hypothetical protein